MNSYQKLKAENINLKRQLMALATAKENDFMMEVEVIREYWKLAAIQEKVVWGDSTESTATKGISQCIHY